MSLHKRQNVSAVGQLKACKNTHRYTVPTGLPCFAIADVNTSANKPEKLASRRKVTGLLLAP